MNPSSEADEQKPKGGPSVEHRRQPVWRRLVFSVLNRGEGPLPLSAIYDQLETEQPIFTQERPHWRDRVRATLQASSDFVRIEPGVWDLSERHSKEAVEALERERRERYPLRPKSDS